MSARVGANAAETVTLKSAWMRPAPAGTQPARAYVDIESTANLKLVGAATPVAARVQLVRVDRIDDPASEVVVREMAVPAGTTTRLAYRGDHLRLTGIKRDVANGDPVPLTLTFRDASGKRLVATDEHRGARTAAPATGPRVVTRHGTRAAGAFRARDEHGRQGARADVMRRVSRAAAPGRRPRARCRR